MLGLIVGGRLDYSYAAEMSKVDTSRTIGVYASASFNTKFVSAGIQTNTVNEQSMSDFEENSVSQLQVYGGQSEYGQNIANDGSRGGEMVSRSPQGLHLCIAGEKNSGTPVAQV